MAAYDALPAARELVLRVLALINDTQNDIRPISCDARAGTVHVQTPL